MYDERTINGYINEVRRQNVLGSELMRVQTLMLESTLHPHENPRQQAIIVACQNQMFKALLTEKARQELVEKMGDDNGSGTQDTSAHPTDNTPRSKRIRDILQQQVA